MLRKPDPQCPYQIPENREEKGCCGHIGDELCETGHQEGYAECYHLPGEPLKQRQLLPYPVT